MIATSKQNKVKQNKQNNKRSIKELQNKIKSNNKNKMYKDKIKVTVKAKNVTSKTTNY